MRLSAQEKIDLAQHNIWREWGEQFGWRLYGSNQQWNATFVLPDRSHFVVPLLARQAIAARLSSATPHES